jgi:hypothetical protein
MELAAMALSRENSDETVSLGGAVRAIRSAQHGILVRALSHLGKGRRTILGADSPNES